jgi:hypothetical protein
MRWKNICKRRRGHLVRNRFGGDVKKCSRIQNRRVDELLNAMHKECAGLIERNNRKKEAIAAKW